MSRQAQTEDSVYMNVIPMVDIMFLLLLFFMLTADFGGRELEEVLLSRGASIKEDKQDEAKDRVNINVFHTTTVKDQEPSSARTTMPRNRAATIATGTLRSAASATEARSWSRRPRIWRATSRNSSRT